MKKRLILCLYYSNDISLTFKEENKIFAVVVDGHIVNYAKKNC